MRKIHRTGLGLAFLCSLAFAASGCFSSPNTSGAKCSSNADCNNGQSCVSGVCKKSSSGGGGSCKSNADCSATQTCTNGSCADNCKGVVCSSNQVCNDATRPGSCVQCLSNTDCPNNGTCNTSTHTCSGGNSGGAKGAACTSSTSCAQGQICDNGTCQPSSYGDCSSLACATGLDCVNAGSQAQNAKECLQPCTATSDCKDLGFVCDTSGDAVTGHCVQNICSPQLPSAQMFGDLHGEPGTFGSTCNAAGSGDGYCWGPLAAQTSQGQTIKLGVCMGNGQAAPGATCDTTASYGNPSQACNAGLCLPTSQTGTAGQCAAFCAIADGNNCAAVGSTPTACIDLQGLGGICFTQDPSPAATGASCTPFSSSHQSLSCVEDDTCNQTTSKCQQYCDLTAATSGCPSGTTCQASKSGATVLGICQ